MAGPTRIDMLARGESGLRCPPGRASVARAALPGV